MTRFIQSDEDLAWHIAQLAEAHPVFAPLSAEAGAVPIRWLDGGFKGLVFVVTGQQISIAAGRAIYNRLEAALDGITAEKLAAAGDDVLRAAGFSAPKIRTLRAIQEAALCRPARSRHARTQRRCGSHPSPLQHKGNRPLDRRGLPPVRGRPPGYLPHRRSRPAGGRALGLCARRKARPARFAHHVRRLVALAKCRRAAAVGLLRGQEERKSHRPGLARSWSRGDIAVSVLLLHQPGWRSDRTDQAWKLLLLLFSAALHGIAATAIPR